MTKLPVMATAALLAAGSLTTTQARAWDGGAVAAGAIGGLAAGAVIGSAVSHAHAGPYAYYDRPAYAYAPAYDAAYVEEPVVRTRRVVRTTAAPRYVHREVYASAAPRRVVRSYVDEPGYYGPVGYRYNWGGPVAVSYGYGPSYWD